MISIKVDANEAMHIRHGNQEILKQVLEAEIERLKNHLAQTTKLDDFRFYQGQIQAHEATIKLLP